MATISPGIAVEGGMFPSDLLEAIAAGDAPGQDVKSFGLESNRRLIDEIQRSFSDARAEWEAYQVRLRRSRQSRTQLTRQYWALPFLENLGFHSLTRQRSLLHIGEEPFDISHFAGQAEGCAPVHVVGGDQELESRVGRRTPHSQVQEYLNRSESLWGLVTNGERLRLLRDSERFTKPTFVEFDLRGIFEGNQYSDFALCYRILHNSRFPSRVDDAPDSWLERYFQQGLEQGGRVRDRLRVGVEAAISEIGRGLLAHAGSSELRESIITGRLTTTEYYRQLLSFVYRVLFLLVAEDRRLIYPMDGSRVEAFAAYSRYYSMSALRERCERYFYGDSQHDRWLGLIQTFRVFRDNDSADKVGLAALDGNLFGLSACPDVEKAQLSNESLLRAVRAISTFPEVGGVRRRVNFAGLDVEELGSVYESLLDLEPRIVIPITGEIPEFTLVSSSQRKQTGSYYTPSELVRELVSSALTPVISQRLEEATDVQSKEQSLLSLKVVDPACGSGHFLLAAARRIATDLAQVRTGDEGATPTRYRRALREVISSCIYGVDKNPMTVDLCKVALWIEGHEPGRPLSFLDHHIRCGDSLVGITDLEHLQDGIPNAAFRPISGDDKEIAKNLSKRNTRERRGQLGLRPQLEKQREWTLKHLELTRMPDDQPDQVREISNQFSHMRRPESAWGATKFICDLWTSGFFSSFSKGLESAISTEIVRGALAGLPIGDKLASQVAATAARHRFFHWQLEFPGVFEEGGFDVVLGNPPWEKVALKEKEFFDGKDEEIASAPNKAARQKLIDELDHKNPALYQQFMRAKRDAERLSRYLRGSGRFPLTGRGDINSYSVFVETGRLLLNPNGRAGMICPSGIATDNTTRLFFTDLIESKSLASLLDFENRDKVFPGIYFRLRFCLLTITGSECPSQQAEFASYLQRAVDLKDPERRYVLKSEDFALFNPNTRTAPTFRSRRDAEIARRMYERAGVFWREGSDEVEERNPWGISFQTMFHMSGDSGLFRTRDQLEEGGFTLVGNEFVCGAERYLPLYESKLFHQFDHRYATFDAASERDLRNGNARPLSAEEKSDPNAVVIPRYWVPEKVVAERIARDRNRLSELRGTPPSATTKLQKLASDWCSAESLVPPMSELESWP